VSEKTKTIRVIMGREEWALFKIEKQKEIEPKQLTEWVRNASWAKYT
jgi:hypothetical protein